jgi:3-dehydroquinate dehydratase
MPREWISPRELADLTTLARRPTSALVSHTATGVICGLGVQGYELAVAAVVRRLQRG